MPQQMFCINIKSKMHTMLFCHSIYRYLQPQRQNPLLKLLQFSSNKYKSAIIYCRQRQQYENRYTLCRTPINTRKQTDWITRILVLLKQLHINLKTKTPEKFFYSFLTPGLQMFTRTSRLPSKTLTVYFMNYLLYIFLSIYCAYVYTYR